LKLEIDKIDSSSSTSPKERMQATKRLVEEGFKKFIANIDMQNKQLELRAKQNLKEGERSSTNKEAPKGTVENQEERAKGAGRGRVAHVHESSKDKDTRKGFLYSPGEYTKNCGHCGKDAGHYTYNCDKSSRWSSELKKKFEERQQQRKAKGEPFSEWDPASKRYVVIRSKAKVSEMGDSDASDESVFHGGNRAKMLRTTHDEEAAKASLASERGPVVPDATNKMRKRKRASQKQKYHDTLAVLGIAHDAPVTMKNALEHMRKVCDDPASTVDKDMLRDTILATTKMIDDKEHKHHKMPKANLSAQESEMGRAAKAVEDQIRMQAQRERRRKEVQMAIKDYGRLLCRPKTGALQDPSEMIILQKTLKAKAEKHQFPYYIFANTAEMSDEAIASYLIKKQELHLDLAAQNKLDDETYGNYMLIISETVEDRGKVLETPKPKPQDLREHLDAKRAQFGPLTLEATARMRQKQDHERTTMAQKVPPEQQAGEIMLEAVKTAHKVKEKQRRTRQRMLRKQALS
jgi:hypothetical protein